MTQTTKLTKFYASNWSPNVYVKLKHYFSFLDTMWKAYLAPSLYSVGIFILKG